MKSTDYQPVHCGLHSEYELLVLQRRSCRLDWSDAAGTMRSLIVTPTDLYTRNSAEFMSVTDRLGEVHEIRLDRIRRCEPDGNGPVHASAGSDDNC